MSTSMRRHVVPVDDAEHVLVLTGPIRHVDCRDPDVLTVWVEHHDDATPRERVFTVVDGGADWPEGWYVWAGTAISPHMSGSMLGSLQRGLVVWHLLEKLEGEPG